MLREEKKKIDERHEKSWRKEKLEQNREKFVLLKK